MYIDINFFLIMDFYISESEEKKLKEEIKKKLILENWNLLDQEYLIIGDYYQFGTGDLIFKKDNKILIVECKHINFNESGRNYRCKRTKARKKVKEQSIYYSACAKLKYRDCIIIGSTYTNESQLKFTCKLNDLQKARNIFEINFKKQHKKSFFNKEIIKELKKFIKI